MASDVFVLPTREDIWGLVVNEALAFGLPVITTDSCVAGLELIINEENGFIVPVDDEITLGRTIQNVVQDPKKLTTMSKISLESVERYTIEQMAREHFNIINQL